MNRPVLVAVDFDGVIVENKFPHIGQAIPRAIETLNFCKDAGCKLILWTCRTGQDLADAVSYCRVNGLEFDAINDNVEGIDYGKPKVVATVYLDDHNIEWMRSGGRNYTADKWQEVQSAVMNLVINNAGEFNAAAA